MLNIVQREGITTPVALINGLVAASAPGVGWAAFDHVPLQAVKVIRTITARKFIICFIVIFFI
jgi:hypothetical protein